MHLSNFIIFQSVIIAIVFCDEFLRAKITHQPQNLTIKDYQYLSNLTDKNQFNQVLDNILIPRVVGTPNHEKVFNYITNELKKLEWNLEIDEFQAKTPIFGVLTFKNIIATLNPQAERFLVLACHYDSKYFKDAIFVGAIDSAVPCAMILNLAHVMHSDLKKMKHSSDLSLKLIFFDGEEAFENWGPNDSIYGAKHLAKKYHGTRSLSKIAGRDVSDLDRIDVFVLLDLIGAKNPLFYSFHESTEKWFLRLVDAEYNLATLHQFKEYNRNYFQLAKQYANIEDDHTPFQQKNVPILHVITAPFPPEWHTPNDNKNLIDLDTVENINKILRVFITEYLHLLLMDSMAIEEDTIHGKEL